MEVKWSDRYCDRPEELKSLLGFCATNGLKRATVTSISKSVSRQVSDVELTFVPASVHRYQVGYNLVHGKPN